MYTSKERVERDGFLIAYEGEVMSEAEAAKRGLIDVNSDWSEADDLRIGNAACNPPIDDEWAAAAGLSVEDCKELWAKDPSAVLGAIKENIGAEGSATDTDGADTNDDAADDGSDPDDQGAPDTDGADGKPSKKELLAECEARGIKAPKNATIAQLEALLED